MLYWVPAMLLLPFVIGVSLVKTLKDLIPFFTKNDSVIRKKTDQGKTYEDWVRQLNKKTPVSNFKKLIQLNIANYYKTDTYGLIIYNVVLSLYVTTNLLTIFMYPKKQLKAQFVKHCCPDKRTDRVNMADLWKILKKKT